MMKPNELLFRAGPILRTRALPGYTLNFGAALANHAFSKGRMARSRSMSRCMALTRPAREAQTCGLM